MEGKIGKRPKLPLLLRCFVPTRLSSEVLAGAYERLLELGDGGAGAEREKLDSPAASGGEPETISTGGR